MILCALKSPHQITLSKPSILSKSLNIKFWKGFEAITLFLKKPGLVPSDMHNYRWISNLPFLSKVLDKVVVAQLRACLSSHNLYECFQLGFRTLHSTETALLRVVNNLFMAVNSGFICILILCVLHHLSSAFDTNSHSVLISRLSALGISALSWFISYQSDHQHYISIHQAKSTTARLTQCSPGFCF